MTDEPGTAIQEARLAPLERVFGSGDMVSMIDATKKNVNAAIDFAREREFVTEYPIERQGKVVGVRLWFHHPTWQLLGQSFGITAYTEGEPKEVKPGVWQAAAVAASVQDGHVVGRAVGLCSKTEPGKNTAKTTDHTLQAIAQTRAQRNALRSCLGAVLIAAGFEISDPEGPVTKEQLAKLHILEREMGMDHDEGHAMAGVESFSQLNRDQANDVIDAWQAIVDEDSGGGVGRSPDAGTPGGDTTQGNARGKGKAAATPASDTPGDPTEAWARAPKDMPRVGAIRLAKRMVDEGRMPGPAPTSQAKFTAEQVAKVSAAWRDGER